MHHRTYIALAALTAALALAAPSASAQGQPAATPSASQSSDTKVSDDCARARRAGHQCLLDFGEGDEIYVTGLTPDGDALTTRTPTVFSSLIRLRTDFIAAIVKSADDLP
jgi:hypothetical protein